MAAEISGEEKGREAGEPPVSPLPAAVQEFEGVEVPSHQPRDLLLHRARCVLAHDGIVIGVLSMSNTNRSRKCGGSAVSFFCHQIFMLLLSSWDCSCPTNMG